MERIARTQLSTARHTKALQTKRNTTKFFNASVCNHWSPSPGQPLDEDDRRPNHIEKMHHHNMIFEGAATATSFWKP